MHDIPHTKTCKSKDRNKNTLFSNNSKTFKFFLLDFLACMSLPNKPQEVG